MSRNPNRREFSKTVASAAAVGLAGANALSAFTGSSTERPALLGGKPVRTQPFPSWPVIRQNDEQAWKEVLASGKWCRLDGSRTTRFETEWAQTVGAKQCLATASGTTALFTTLKCAGRRTR